jgi:multidrug resistance efflux pump
VSDAPTTPVPAAPAAATPAPSATPTLPPLPSAPPPRQGGGRGWLLPVAVVAVVAVGAGLAWSGVLTGTPDATPGPTAPGPVPADPSVVAEGRTVPARWAELSFGTPGLVAEVAVGDGASVAAGAVLVRLDTTLADADVAAATAAVAAAEARVAQAAAALVQATEAVAAAEASVGQAVAARTAAIAARDALPSGVSAAVRRQATAEIERATAARTAADAQLRSARAGVTVAEGGLAAAEADADRARASLDAATAARDLLTIRAPWAGTVVAVDAVPGQRVGAGMPIVRLLDPAAGWRFETLDLSETAIARISGGAAVTVTVDGLPDAEIPGRVIAIGGFGTPRQGDVVFRVVAEPTGDVPDGLRWNMTVTLEIATER